MTENYVFRNPHKSSFPNTDLPVDSVETGKGLGHLFLGPLTLKLVFNAFHGTRPKPLSWWMVILEAPEKLAGLCLCDKMLAEGRYKKFKVFHFLSGKSPQP